MACVHSSSPLSTYIWFIPYIHLGFPILTLIVEKYQLKFTQKKHHIFVACSITLASNTNTCMLYYISSKWKELKYLKLTKPPSLSFHINLYLKEYNDIKRSYTINFYSKKISNFKNWNTYWNQVRITQFNYINMSTNKTRQQKLSVKTQKAYSKTNLHHSITSLLSIN